MCPLIRLNRDLIPKLPILSPTSLLGYDILCRLPHVFYFLSIQPLTTVLLKKEWQILFQNFYIKDYFCANIVSHLRQHDSNMG